MNANGGAGKVTQRMVPLMQNANLRKTQMMACRHGNGKDWWLLKQEGGNADEHTFLFTQDSVYDKGVQLFNNPDDVSRYLLESSRALNLGVYGADLNVASIYDQTQESMLFFKCVSIIAKSIGVSNSFDENMGDRMTANQSNRDSTLSIITQAFKSADETLRKNNRPGTSSLLVAGAWIEGLYVACQTAKETKNEPIVKEIFAQKESLDNLLELLQSSKLPDETAYVLEDLKALKTIIDSKSDNVFTLDAMKELDTKITDLRTKIISSK